MVKWYTPILILVAMLILDGIWIMGINKTFYQTELNRVQGQSDDVPLNVNKIAAVGSYILVFISILLIAMPLAYHFHSMSNSTDNSASETKLSLISSSLLAGALVGLCTYGIYNWTNKATLTAYSWEYVARDTLWGILLTATVTLLAVNV